MRLRILYHGLGMAGKTTNLEKLKEIYTGYLSDRFHQQTQEGRTVYLDMLALNIKTRKNDIELYVELFTTPGQERFKLLRKWLFGHVDGVVFVFDCSRNVEENLRAYAELEEYGLSSIPLVVQANKADLLKDQSFLEEVRRLFNGHQVVPAVAIEGIGVAETFREVLREVLNAKAVTG